MATARFDLYEKVRVNSTNPALAEIIGETGAILGKAECEDGTWSYAVQIYRDGRVWSCREDELITTGEFDQQESLFSGRSIRVSVRGEALE